MNEDEKKKVISEANVLLSLRHPNIVNVREVYKAKKGKICIVTDYADGESLLTRINAKFTSNTVETDKS